MDLVPCGLPIVATLRLMIPPAVLDFLEILKENRKFFQPIFDGQEENCCINCIFLVVGYLGYD